MARNFENSIFINCAFDKEFEPVLQAIAFCAIHLGFYPRIAPENADNAIPRIDRIADIISSSKYGIHDLSRCKSVKKGEFARMNMVRARNGLWRQKIRPGKSSDEVDIGFGGPAV